MSAILAAILAAFVSGVFTLIGVIINSNANNRQIENKLITAQAVTDNKIDNLATEVRKHNNFAEKVPILMERVRVLEERCDKMQEHIKELKYL